MGTDIFADLSDQLDWQTDVYKDLHRHPELSMQEEKTSARIRKELEGLGLTVKSFGPTGLVTAIENGKGPVVLARADFDALPVTEATGLDYASETEGVMHACGHDMHTATLLGAVKVMNEQRDAWSGTYIALFQPGEEIAAGARSMIDAGLVDALPTPDVVIGQHVMPARAGTVATGSGPVMSAGDSIKITLHGRGAHGSMPNLAVDPVVLAASVIMKLQTVVSRENAPGDFAVLTVGSVRAGEKSNIIPGSAELLLNMRTYDTEVRSRMIAAIERIVRAECEAAACPVEPEIEYYDQFPLTDNHTEPTEKITARFVDYFGEDTVTDSGQVTASEDFSLIPRAFEAPYLYWFLGCMDPKTYDRAAKNGTVSEDIPANHSPYFAPVIDPTLEMGTKTQVLGALAYLGR